MDRFTRYNGRVPLDLDALAHELLAAHAAAEPIAVPPTSRDAGFDLAAAYQVEQRIVALRKQAGHAVRGLKVGFANKAIWRALKLETLVWGHVYDDTVHMAGGNRAEYRLKPSYAPRIEPEIVLAWKRPIEAAGLDAVTVLREHVDWIALGFEIVDCPFPDWKFSPVDFVAALGIHRGLIVGEPLKVDASNAETLAGQLAAFQLRLLNGGELAEEGAGKNSLRSPALCLAELGGVLAQRGLNADAAPGMLVSSGSLTNARDIAVGQTWRAEVDGIDLPPLEATFI
jgi:2-keto-4-pentenoate hydratase